MNLWNSLVCALVPLVLLAVLLPTHTAATNADVEIAGRAVTMELVKSDLSPLPWPTEKIDLVTETIVAGADVGIFDLLDARGILPDNEAYTLVYDLNPNLKTIDPLPKASLVLPLVTGGPLLRQALANGYRVMLTVDQSLKAQLDKNAIAISEITSRLPQTDRSVFADPTGRDNTISQMKDLAVWFEHMRKTFARRTAKPLRRVTLMQIVYEADVITSMWSHALSPGQKLSTSDQAQIAAIQKDIEQAITKWDETMTGGLSEGEPQFNVVVEIRGNDLGKIQHLRVYYVVAGLFRNPPVNPPVRSTNFTGLGSGSSAVLPIKNYKIWAAQDGDPEHPQTPPADLMVRKPAEGNVIRFVLSLTMEKTDGAMVPSVKKKRKRARTNSRRLKKTRS